MKKLLIGFLTLVTTAAFGQVRQGNDVVIAPQFGVYGGLNVANQWEGGYSDNALAGGVEGIQVAFPISYAWFIQPEITYSNMGTQFYANGDDGGNAGTYNLHMNYLSVPILFKWSIPFTGFGILFGPQYSYLLAAHQNTPGASTALNVKPYYNTSDVSGVVGLEYYFPNNPYYRGPKFGFSTRYQFGFLNVNKGNGATYDVNTGANTNTSITNNAWSLTFGIRF